MADVFGFSLNGDLATGSDQLSAMSRGIKGRKPALTPAMLVDTSGAVASTQSETDVYRDDRTLVAVCGHPYWKNSELAALSKSRGLADTIAKAFREHDVSLLQRLQGPFALAILIPAEKRTILATDRLGIMPLAWMQSKDGIIFSSDAGAIRSHPSVDVTIDPQGLYNYFYFHMVPSPGSIYAGIEKLEPAQYVDIIGTRAQRAFYWQTPYSESATPTTELAITLQEKLQQAVTRAATQDSTGAFLSGGLDSSTVAGYFARIAEGQADAYGIGFDAEGYDEMAYARAAAKHFGIKLHEYYVTPGNVADAVPQVAAAYDEPFGNASAIPAYFCARLAKQDGKTTLLAGDGGDEIFAGNARYAKQRVFDLYRRIPAPVRKSLIEPLATHFPMKDQFTPVRKLNSYIQQANMPMPERLESYNFLHRTDPDEIFDKDFLNAVDTHDPIENQRDAYDRAHTPEMLKRMLHLDLKITLADNDLRKVSRMCQMAGIDVRYPMLDEELVEFSASVPSRLLLKGNRLRDFYKQSLKDFLPPETLNKSKHGFGLPFGVWMGQDKRLKELADASLVRLRSRGFIQPAYIDRLLEAHRSEHADYYGVMIWVMMMLEQWMSSHGH